MKNLEVSYFEKIEFLPKLLKYFALSPENKVRCEGYFDNIHITYFQDDGGKFHKVVENSYDSEPYDFTMGEMDLETLYSIISQLEHLPSMHPEFGWTNMKEQVNLMSCAYHDPRIMDGIK